MNALTIASAEELKLYEQQLKHILDSKVSEYDVKAAYYLLQTKLDYKEGFTIPFNW